VKSPRQSLLIGVGSTLEHIIRKYLSLGEWGPLLESLAAIDCQLGLISIVSWSSPLAKGWTSPFVPIVQLWYGCEVIWRVCCVNASQ
jgi:hypothetical protein